MKEEIKLLYLKDKKLAIEVAKALGYKIESKQSYPLSYDAEFLADLTNKLNTVSTAGCEIGKDLMNKIHNLRLKAWNKVFGDKSPWSAKRAKGDKLKVFWDKDKAKRLNLGK